MDMKSLRQAGDDFIACRTAGGVADHEDGDASRAAGEELDLLVRQRAAHERDRRHVYGVEAKDREEALDEHAAYAARRDAVETEQHVRFPEARG